MANPPLSKKAAQEAVTALNKCLKDGYTLRGRPAAMMEGARRLNMTWGAFNNRIRTAERLYGIKPHDETPIDVDAALIGEFKGGKRKSRAELSNRLKTSLKAIDAAIEKAMDRGVNVHRTGDKFEIPQQHREAFIGGPTFELISNANNEFVFGASGDLHAASKYTRWDVREDLYRQFSEGGAQCVFDTGNWIDGEASFNRYDIETHGLDEQCRQLAYQHPMVRGLPTYAVWGDDHEGWYASREGIDVGKYCESIMRERGHDWTNIGFMEAHVILKNANTGSTAKLSVVHPGGGSSYAVSYTSQKLIESLEGGEKPDVALYGHYHKLWAGLIRGVWVAQTGTAQDQTPFMRKKRLEAHVGGCLIKLKQDPKSGAITSMTPELIRYFNRGWYAGRWSKHGAVRLAERGAGPR